MMMTTTTTTMMMMMMMMTLMMMMMTIMMMVMMVMMMVMMMMLLMRGGQCRGTALRDARRNKERTYPELLRDRRCRLVVFGIEGGGRWSDAAATFLRLLAHTKARQAPALLRHSLTNALTNRWSAMLTHAAMHAFATSLLDQDQSGYHNLEGNAPSISEIFAEATSPSHYSRLSAPS